MLTRSVHLWLIVCFACLAASSVLAERREQDGQVLMVGHCFTPVRSAAMLAWMSEQHDDRASWEARRALIRRGILEGAMLDRLPEDREPPGMLWRGTHEMDGYTVHGVAIETMPGFWLCGNLYYPAGFDADNSEPIPLVLSPHGHRQDKRFTEDVQSRSAAMARMGCAVFAYDMVGHGETTQIPHRTEQTLRLQTFNSIRALDFFCSLPFIDQDRIAVTGCSGGGTQTFLLAAIDDRVDLAMPVCQISAYFYGGCVCESGMPIHVRGEHQTNNVEFAACFAPKPLLMVSNGDDWTDHTPQSEFPYVQRVYGYYDAADNVRNAHFPDEGHDYGPSKRAAAYRFLAEHFELDLSAVQDGAGEIDESWLVLLSREVLSVFNDEHPRPDGALDNPAAVFSRLDAFMSGQ